MASNEPVRVEQCDREAAKAYNDAAIEALLDPQGDPMSLLVQAFARNRIRFQADGRRALQRVASNARFDWLGRDTCNAVRAALPEVHQEKNDASI